MSAASSRRGFLAAFGSFAGTAPARVAFPALALPAIIAPALATAKAADPREAPLIEAGRIWTDAVSAECEARRLNEEGEAAFRRGLGECPPSIIMSDRWESWDHDALYRVSQPHGRQLHAHWEQTVTGAQLFRWDGRLLRLAIKHWVTVNGRGGTTPNDIRRLKGMLPIADERDALDASLAAGLDLDRKSDAERETRKATMAAEDPILALPAYTLAGVAVKARLVAHVFERWRRNDPKLSVSAYYTTVVEAVIAAESAARDGEA